MVKKRSILILCGGTGPRLWPMSRATKPKQFLKIFGESSFLRQTAERALSILPKEDIYFISNSKYLKQIKADLKGLVLEKNIFGEPEKKNTMMAIMYGVSRIGGGSVATLPSDHFIDDIPRFKKDIEKAFDLSEKLNSIVTIGIRPSWPNPSFGYIESEKKDKNYLKVKRFVEKPDIKKAEMLIKTGAWWNSGMYVFRESVLEQELMRCNKDYFKIWEKLKDRPGATSIYHLSPALAIDKVISEKSKNLVGFEAGFDWSDVGEWGSIYKKLVGKTAGVVSFGKETQVVSEKSSKCLVHGLKNKVIGLVGVSGLAIVDTKDALLVADMNDSFQVRDLITRIVSDKKLAKYFLEENE